MSTEIRHHWAEDEMMMDLINRFPTGIYRWTGNTAWFQVDFTEFELDVEITWFAKHGRSMAHWMIEKGYDMTFEHDEED